MAGDAAKRKAGLPRRILRGIRYALSEFPKRRALGKNARARERREDLSEFKNFCG